MSDPFDFSDDPFPPSAPAPGSPQGMAPGPGAPPMAPVAPRYLETLNDTQREAVETIDGPVLVLAGAGTGKTRVLTTRLAHVLSQGRARPWEVLAVTFTNKAAREMKDRVAQVLGQPVEGWWVGTFHSIGARLLRANAEAAGLTPNFTILDTDDQIRLLKQYLEQYEIDDKRWPARTLAGAIQRWKDRGLMPGKVPEAEAAGVADGKGLEIYAAYQERLKILNAADFGDLLLLCLDLFQREPEILAKYQRQFRYILVDEYQDTNVSQYLWLRLLAQAHKNICCVGDDDQSIYSWRGAEVGNILRFEKDFPAAHVVRLERNYRSTPHILAAASGLIAQNEGRLGKTLWTDTNDQGEKVLVRGVWDGDEEARVVGEEIEALHSKQHRLNQIAVLVRAGFQTREFEERLITLGVPYRVLGGPRFYERQEIRDAIAYLRVLAQPSDDLAFERIVNTPKRGLGAASLQVVHGHARAQGLPLIAAAWELLETEELKPRARNSLRTLLEDFERWRVAAGTMPHTELTKLVLDESGYTTMLQTSKAPEAPGRLDNLKELIVALGDFENLAGFLEHVSLVMENEESAAEDKVTLMTLHGAKGLEFDTVFLPGWEEGLFPHQRAMDEAGVAGLEEERRLAYVGLTRARQRVIVTFAANRRVYGQWQSAIPSRFIDELPEENIERRQETGLYGGPGGSIGASRGASGGAAFGGARGLTARSRLNEGGGSPSWKTSEGTAAAGLDVGVRVFHQKFGYGEILAKDGDKLEVAFEKAGTKRVMASFVEVH